MFLILLVVFGLFSEGEETGLIVSNNESMNQELQLVEITIIES